MDDPLEQAKGYQNMGVAYRDMGDHDRAMECFRKSVELREAASKLRAHANHADEKP
jgi:tetratricopeptide (TPR) repeat protein